VNFKVDWFFCCDYNCEVEGSPWADKSVMKKRNMVRQAHHLTSDKFAYGKIVFGIAGSFLLVVFVYILFAVYLFYPCLKKSGPDGLLFIFSAAIASVGAFLLSRRWTSDFLGSFFSVALYGFGPFMVALVRFHPFASLLASAVPWLFLPAVFGPPGRRHLFRILMGMLPFLSIIVFFQLASHYRLFPVPLRAGVRPADLTGFIWPLAAAEQELNPVGLYHIANALFFIGFVMMIKARRYKVMAALAAGAILAFCPPVLEVSPIMWFSITSVGIAILAGAGLSGLVLAGFSDKRWVLAAAFLSALFSIAAFIFASGYFQGTGVSADFSTLFAFSGRFHLLAVLVLLVIFFMLHSQIRLTLVRRLLISTALLIDIFFAAPYIANCMM
jgi:hypothetical protein